MHEDFSDLVSMWARITTRYAERPLFGEKRASGWVWQTYAEVAEQVDAFRAALGALGVGRGDRVALISDNRLEWAITVHATLGLARSTCRCTNRRRRGLELHLARLGRQGRVRATREIVSALEEAKPGLPSLSHICGFNLDASDARSFAAMMKRGRSAAKLPTTAVAPDDNAAFVYTSGTTGEPKGVVLTHKNFCANVNGLTPLFPLTSEDRSLSFLPWATRSARLANFTRWPRSVARWRSTTKCQSSSVTCRT
jgi:long-chain acyl-CoA synthetase